MPPSQGNYTFLCSADDYLYLEGVLANGTEIPLCSTPQWTYFRSWNQFPSQVHSAPKMSVVLFLQSIPLHGLPSCLLLRGTTHSCAHLMTTCT
jgi:hypothetical protein